MNKMRSYQSEIVYRIQQLKSRFLIRTIGKLKFGRWNYPLYLITAGRSYGNSSKKDVLLSGIVHGDEPAGGLAILYFLDQLADKYLDQFRFFCYPCVNPSGFETNMRVNMRYDNLNRSFKDPAPTQEIECIYTSLKPGPYQYHFTVDMHESPPLAIDPEEDYGPEDNPTDFWLWETATKDSGLRIGDKIIDQLIKEGVSVCHWPKIYGDINNNGVIWYPDNNRNVLYAAGTSFDSYLYKKYTRHSFTFETPTFWTLERRVRTHAQALCLALELSV